MSGMVGLQMSVMSKVSGLDRYVCREAEKFIGYDSNGGTMNVISVDIMALS